MATIFDTMLAFDKANQELGVTKPSQYIQRMLREERALADVDGKSSMHLSLAGNNHLKTSAKLGDEDVAVLYRTLSSNYYVTGLDLRYNRITDSGAALIARLLEDNAVLKHLNLSFNDIQEAGAEAIAAALQKNDTLTFLKMCGNKIGNRGGMAFAQMLQVNASLETLDLADTDQKSESLIALATVLNNNATVRHLDVSRPVLSSIGEEAAVHFARMLKLNASSLKRLFLRKFDMRDFGCARLAEGLLSNTCLTHLDLSSNRITRDGMEELAKVLFHNTPIQYLDLSNNRLECPGAIHLANAIRTANTTLKSIAIRFNNIKGKGLCAIADALKYNSSVEDVFIWGNVLEESACIAFEVLLNEHRLEPTNVDVRPYVVDKVTYLAELSNAPLRHFYWKPVYGDDVPSPEQ